MKGSNPITGEKDRKRQKVFSQAKLKLCPFVFMSLYYVFQSLCRLFSLSALCLSDHLFISVSLMLCVYFSVSLSFLSYYLVVYLSIPCFCTFASYPVSVSLIFCLSANVTLSPCGLFPPSISK